MMENSGGYSCCPNGNQCNGSAGISSGLGFNSSPASPATSMSTSTSSSPLASGPVSGGPVSGGPVAGGSAAGGSAAGGGATGPLAVSQITILVSFLIGLFPGLLG